jgi:ribosomal protein S13
LIQNKLFNNKLLDSEETLFFNILNNYGFKSNLINILEQRFENDIKIKLNNFNKNDLEILFNILYTIIPYKSSIFKRKSFNIFMLDIITSYRGWRHFKGLPVRGQRTWSNA